MQLNTVLPLMPHLYPMVWTQSRASLYLLHVISIPRETEQRQKVSMYKYTIDILARMSNEHKDKAARNITVKYYAHTKVK
jgi:hypothetical protein